MPELRIGMCVPVPPWKSYAFPLLAQTLVDLRYPGERLDLLILLDAPNAELLQVVEAWEPRLRAAFRQVVIETGTRVERVLRQRTVLTALSPPEWRGYVHLTRLRQRMLEHFLYATPEPVDAVFFLDADSLWPQHTLHELLAVASFHQSAAVGLLPYRHPDKHMLLFWFPNPPEGRLLAYNPPDIPRTPFPVDFATMGGTLVPRALLEDFAERGGWYPYPVSGFPDHNMADDAYLFLGSGRRLPLWACPDVCGWHVEADGWGQRFRREGPTGEPEICERQIRLDGPSTELWTD
jgi:hypothetical protein